MNPIIGFIMWKFTVIIAYAWTGEFLFSNFQSVHCFESRWMRPGRISAINTSLSKSRFTSRMCGESECDNQVPSNSRRDLFKHSAILWAAGISAMTTTMPPPAYASDVRGPVELLRPATRVKVYIQHAIDICTEIQKNGSTDPSSLEPLARVFEQEPMTFMTTDETKLSKRYLEIDTSSAWQSARLKEREARGAEIGVDYTTPYDKFNTAVQQWGDKTQFRILRSRQRNLEKSDSIRAAFNAYTNNLVFGDAYQLNVQGDEKKNLVRNNALPDVNAVVVSDLDLRDLYRNQVLENMDNAKAELAYQLKSAEIDAGEILSYLVGAQTAANEWFSFIPKDDVEKAYNDVAVEK